MNDMTGYLRSDRRKAIKTGRLVEVLIILKNCIVTAADKHEFLQ